MTRQTYTDGQQNKLKLQEKTHKHKAAWQTNKKGESNKNKQTNKQNQIQVYLKMYDPQLTFKLN